MLIEIPFRIQERCHTIDIMSVTISTQQSDWNSNVYVVTVTRVLVGVGVFYLVRSIVQLVQWSYFSQPSRRTNSEQPNPT